MVVDTALWCIVLTLRFHLNIVPPEITGVVAFMSLSNSIYASIVGETIPKSTVLPKSVIAHILLSCSGVNMEGACTIWGLIAACSGSILYLFCSAAEGEGGEGASLCLSC